MKHEGKAAKTAPVAAVDVLGAEGDIGVTDTEPPLPEPHPDPLVSPLLGDAVLDAGVDDAILTTKRSQVFLNFNLEFEQTHAF